MQHKKQAEVIDGHGRDPAPDTLSHRPPRLAQPGPTTIMFARDRVRACLHAHARAHIHACKLARRSLADDRCADQAASRRPARPSPPTTAARPASRGGRTPNPRSALPAHGPSLAAARQQCRRGCRRSPWFPRGCGRPPWRIKQPASRTAREGSCAALCTGCPLANHYCCCVRANALTRKGPDRPGQRWLHTAALQSPCKPASLALLAAPYAWGWSHAYSACRA